MIEYALQCKTQTNIRTKKGLHSDFKKRRGKKVKVKVNRGG